LDAGADDYLTKPFSYVVLHAHLRALARRGAHGGEDEPSVLRRGDLVLDHRERRCTRGDDEIMLSRREFDILGRELMDRIWGSEFNGDPNILEVYVSYLRKKIDAPFGRRSLETVRGFGYRLIDEHQN
jgi:DNA-binding response OmpR family regulator